MFHRVKNSTFILSTAPTTHGKTPTSVCVCVWAHLLVVLVILSWSHLHIPSSQRLTWLHCAHRSMRYPLFSLADKLTRSIEATSAGVEVSTYSCASGSPSLPPRSVFFPLILLSAAYWQSYSSHTDRRGYYGCHLIIPYTVNVLLSFVWVWSRGGSLGRSDVEVFVCRCVHCVWLKWIETWGRSSRQGKLRRANTPSPAATILMIRKGTRSRNCLQANHD